MKRKSEIKNCCEEFRYRSTGLCCVLKHADGMVERNVVDTLYITLHWLNQEDLSGSVFFCVVRDGPVF